MKQNNIIIASVMVAVGLLLLGMCIGSAMRDAFMGERIVSVKGLSEREVEADRVIWPLAYQALGDDLGEMYNYVNTNNGKIVSFLRQNGIKDSDITVGAPKVTDLNANQYSENRTGHRYIVKAVVTVASEDVPLIRKLMLRQNELLSKGIAIMGNDYENPTIFSYNSLNDIKPHMIEEATKNARHAAEKFANDSGSELGQIKRASQGQFSINERDSNTPYIMNVRVVTSIDYYLK